MKIENLLSSDIRKFTFGLLGIGRKLGTMGCCWFLSCLYNEKIDSSHLNFAKAGKTLSCRLCAFKQTREFHKVLFFYIKDDMSLNDLAKNKLDLSIKDLNAMITSLSAVR